MTLYLDELEVVTWELKNEKSLGLCGLLVEFYMLWHVVGPTYFKMCQVMIHCGCLYGGSGKWKSYQTYLKSGQKVDDRRVASNYTSSCVTKL